jgi:hypothetical protein
MYKHSYLCQYRFVLIDGRLGFKSFAVNRFFRLKWGIIKERIPDKEFTEKT